MQKPPNSSLALLLTCTGQRLPRPPERERNADCSVKVTASHRKGKEDNAETKPPRWYRQSLSSHGTIFSGSLADLEAQIVQDCFTNSNILDATPDNARECVRMRNTAPPASTECHTFFRHKSDVHSAPFVRDISPCKIVTRCRTSV